MHDIDDTDRRILDLLLEDGRRSWRRGADAVDLSAPAVADRVERLEELGVIRGFTADVDRTKLAGGTPVLATLTVDPSTAESVAGELAEAGAVDHVFTTADGRVVFSAGVPDGDVLGLVESRGVLTDVRDVDVTLMRDDPLDVLKAVRVSEGTLAKIKQNLFWALGYNTAMIPMASLGLLQPALAAAAMAASSVSVLGNSLLFRRYVPAHDYRVLGFLRR